MLIQQLCMNCFSQINGANPCPFCGYDRLHPAVKPQVLYPGTTFLGKYVLGRVIGQGGFGITYLGLDLATEKKIAIKEFFPTGLAVRQGSAVISTGENGHQLFNKGVDAFYQEAQIISQFNNQPNIVHVQAFFRENSTAYIVMEYLEGQSFKDYLQMRGGRISLSETENILLPVMDALTIIHQAGLLHRDVAPDNISLTKEGTPKLIDFGAARFSISDQTLTLSTIIKPGYAPIEQYGGLNGQGPWTDVYATGATFYRALTGIVPVPSPERSMGRNLIPLSAYGIDIPEHIEQAIMKAMAVKPENRFQTMQEFRNALGNHVSFFHYKYGKNISANVPQTVQPITQIKNIPYNSPVQLSESITQPKPVQPALQTTSEKIGSNQTGPSSQKNISGSQFIKQPFTKKTPKLKFILAGLAFLFCLLVLIFILNSANSKKSNYENYIIQPMQGITLVPYEENSNN